MQHIIIEIGSFFGSNKKLVAGDKIYIIDATGNKVEYTIYKTYTVGEMDFSYATRDTRRKKGNFTFYMYK